MNYRFDSRTGPEQFPDIEVVNARILTREVAAQKTLLIDDYMGL